jgi:hypothetical protein
LVLATQPVRLSRAPLSEAVQLVPTSVVLVVVVDEVVVDVDVVVDDEVVVVGAVVVVVEVGYP